MLQPDTWLVLPIMHTKVPTPATTICNNNSSTGRSDTQLKNMHWAGVC